MSMNATDEVVRRSATFLATVDFPDPEPPAIPIIKGLSIVSKARLRVSGTHYAASQSDSNRQPKRSPMRIQSIAFAFYVLAVAACSGFAGGSGNDPNQPTVVQVDNQGFADMTVYVLRNSQRVRLGTATGNSKSSFTIPTSVVRGLETLRFIADPIGGRRNSVSEEITVAPGDTVSLTIPPI